MGFKEWLSRLKLLSRVSGSSWCWGYDACPAVRGLVASIDGYSMGESLLPWMSLEDWGWKATVAAAADVAAVGGRPLHVLYSIGVPSFEDAVKVASGVRDAAGWMGAKVGKSDLNRSRSGDGWIDVAVVGEAATPIGRGGAREGDVVIQAGYLGYGAVEYVALQGLVSVSSIPEPILRYTRRPTPPISLGPYISLCRAHAASDNSDGWAATLASIAVESGVSIKIERLEAPLDVIQALKSLNVDLDEMLLSSWEDYNMAIIAPPDSAKCILKACSRLGYFCKVVGFVESGEPSVYYKDAKVEPRGWVSI